MTNDEAIAKFAAADFDARRAVGGFAVTNAPGGESWVAADSVDEMIEFMAYERDEE